MLPPPPSRRARLAVALAIGSIAFVAVALRSVPEGHAFDFQWPYRAARYLAAGVDPYAVIQDQGAYPYNSPLWYPLPAALVVLPVASLPAPWAGAAFVAAGSALLAWGLTLHSWHRLPAFLSASYLLSLTQVQWAPLMTAAALLPSLGFLLVAKPNLGLAAFAYNPTRRGALLAVVAVVLSLALEPGWPVKWRATIAGGSPHDVPLLAWRAGGPLLLLALLRWRRPEARLLAVMACVPQSAWFYDQLAVAALVPATRRQSLAAAAANVTAFVAWLALLTPGTPALTAARGALPYVVLGCYLPALFMVLRRPNVSPARAPELDFGSHAVVASRGVDAAPTT